MADANNPAIQRAIKVGWKPHQGSQTIFLACPVFECLLEGTRGGGKTDALLMSFAQFVGQGFGAAWRGVLFRETYPQLADVVKKSKRWFWLIFPGAKFNEADFKWTFPTGEELLFRHGTREDDYWNYHGHEYPWIGFEELTNWRDSKFYEAMLSCCRSSQPGMPRMVRSTTNPYGRGHGWVKERFRLGTGGVSSGQIQKDDKGRMRTFVHSSIYENTILLQNDPDYMATLESIKDPNRRKAWLEGNWDINIGAFLEHCWNPAVHVVKPFPIPSSWKVWRGMDWGYAHPYSVHWYALDPDGCHYIWRELYGCAVDDKGNIMPNVGTKESPETVAKRIADREQHDERQGLDYGYSYAGTDIFGAAGKQYGVNHTIAKVFRDNGVVWQEAWTAKGSRTAGALEVIRLLEAEKLKVFDTCKHWLRTVPSIPPDADNLDDVDTEAEDHCFPADTLVMTNEGPRRIDSIGSARVLNDAGRWVDHQNWRVIRKNAELVRVIFEDGTSVVCTPDHKFMDVEHKYCRAIDLMDRICYARSTTCKSQSSAKQFKSSMECATINAGITSSAKESVFIGLFGSTSTAQYLTDTTSTTKTVIEQPTNYQTLIACLDQITFRITQKASQIGLALKLASRRLRLGISQRLEGLGTKNTTKSTAKMQCTRPLPKSVSNADCILLGKDTLSFAIPTAKPKTFGRGIRVIRVEPAGRADTGCITVMNRHNFALSNGVIVSNCWDETRYAVMRRRSIPQDKAQIAHVERSLVNILEDGSHRFTPEKRQ